jgi:hypothetical protein
LDDRRAQQVARQQESVPVEHTLNELGIEATPEDVQAEVRRLREAQAASARQTHRQRRQRRWRTGLLALAGLGTLSGGLSWLSQDLRRGQSARFEQKIAAYRQEAAQQTHSWSLSPHTLVLDSSGGKVVVRTLAEVPSGRMVRVSHSDFYGGERRTASELMADAAAAGTWNVVKHEGRVYLRAWLPGPMSAAALAQGRVWLTNTRVSGEVKGPTFWDAKHNTFEQQTQFVAKGAVPVTLPLEGLRFDVNQGAWLVGKYQVARVGSGIRPDHHLFEPW